MRVWTVHLPPGAAPVLVPEAFSWGACLLPVPWLAAHRLWLPLAGWLALAALAVLLPAGTGAALLALHLAAGWHGQDLRRRALARRGNPAAHVVAERDADLALARLVAHRPDLLRAALA